MSAVVDAPAAPQRFGGATAARAVRWSSLSVLGRQGFQILFALVVARILGPASYGVVSAATVYVTLSALLLDQGVSSALVQRRDLDPRAPGAAVSVNLLFGLVCAVVTWGLADLVALFFQAPALAPILRVLAVGLLVKALAIAPRAMLLRGLRMRAVAVADIAGAGVGATAGITAALAGAGPAAIVFMTVGGDLVSAVVLVVAGRGPVPNLDFRAFTPLLRYGVKVFATNGVAYLSRNTDNVLVGRLLGVTALSYYSMGYRILVIPVQFIGQSVNRVMFPVFSRHADDRAELARQLVTATELLAMVTVPAMALLACAAPQLVLVVLGGAWLPAAPLMAVLALAGARETIFYITPALTRATGRAGLNLWFELGSTAVQVTGIVIGLQYGVQGVAVGYAVAGFALTPVLLLLQRTLTGVRIVSQLGALIAPVHAAIWASGAYLVIAVLLDGLPQVVILAAGAAGFAAVLCAVLWLVHPDVTARQLARLAQIAGRRAGHRGANAKGVHRAA